MQYSNGVDYNTFLRNKIDIAASTGFEVSPDEIHPALKAHQKDAVIWALRGGRRALFESFGLGKTIQQIEFCRQVSNKTGGRCLLVMPLGVKQEFTNDAVNLLGMERPPYVKTMAEIMAIDAPLVLTNYERVRDGDIDPAYFEGSAGLDEAAVLRSFGSKTYQTFLDKFKGVPYKLVCTATPSPNKLKELIHYAGFLEIMDTGQALTRFFKRDSTQANNLTLYPGKEREFWLWVSSWALFITKPSDLGYDDAGYDLPPLDIRYHEVNPNNGPVLDGDGQLMLERNASASLQEGASEKRASLSVRVAKAKEIVLSEPDNHFILWHDLEDERKALLKEIPGTIDIYGSMDYEEREQRVMDFADGKIKLFATKKILSGSGCNFQRHCHRAIFVGVDYKFEDFIQAIHRIYRFLQNKPVRIDIIFTGSERGILDALRKKWKQHEDLQREMVSIIKEYGLSGSKVLENLARSIGVKRVEINGQHFKAVNNDCVIETAEMEENSIGLIHTSIPFGNHYEYSASYNDFGHNESDQYFFEQMEYLSPQLLRVLQPGRVMAVHVKDRVLFGNATGTGMPTMQPFHAQCIDHYIRHGFAYFGMITVVTDVVRENNQTYRLGWSEQCKDGTKMGVGCPEYILLFRKLPTDRSTAYADVPVTKSKAEYTRAQWQIDAHGFWRSSGDRLITKTEIEAAPVTQLQKLYRKYSRDSIYSYEEHIELAKKLDEDGRLPSSFMVVAPGSWHSDVWDDINRMRTLNTSQSKRRQQMHICPLQIDIVERIINRYSSPGDTVYDPFGGLMTVPYIAVKMGRFGIGCELAHDYFRDGVGYLQTADAEMEAPTLFDLANGI